MKGDLFSIYSRWWSSWRGSLCCGLMFVVIDLTCDRLELQIHLSWSYQSWIRGLNMSFNLFFDIFFLLYILLVKFDVAVFIFCHNSGKKSSIKNSNFLYVVIPSNIISGMLKSLCQSFFFFHYSLWNSREKLLNHAEYMKDQTLSHCSSLFNHTH